jgi:cell shape-determining protein MreC
MIYPQRDNRRKKKKLVATTSIIVAVLVIIFALNFFNPNLFSPLLHATGRPIFEARGGILGSINNAWLFFHSKAELVTENNALKQKLALTEAIQAERDYYKNYNAELLRKVGRIIPDQQNTVARIVSKPGFSPYDTIIIDVGKYDGITIGDPVMASESLLLGEVKEVYGRTSLVYLYSSPNHETQVLIGPKAIHALAIGKGGGNFEIKLPRNTEVKVGDTVSYATSSHKIFGTIQVVNISPTDTFERALFKNAADVAELSTVIVEKHDE